MDELLTVAQMRAAEMSHGDLFGLMHRAGEAVAVAAAAMVPAAARIAVLCGPGNNGGDGFVAGRALREAGFVVTLGLLGERSALRGDAARAAALWDGPVQPAVVPAGAALVVDALFGAGLNRAPAGEAATLIAAVNASGVPVLAVDVPSGLDADTGLATGACIQASRTITFHRRKPGHLLLPGRGLCGAVVVADLGLAETPGTLHANTPALWAAAWPGHAADTHKFRRGACLVWSGPEFATGAARLAAQAALRVGAGIVTLMGEAPALRAHAAHVTAILLAENTALAAHLADPRLGACIIGPGAGRGPATRDAALAMLRAGHATVLDADALTSLASRPIPGRAVLTPHEGEFRTLFPDLTGPRLERTRAATRACGQVVLLKGPDTVIAAPDGRAAINENAPHWLATAGSGDVLAGIIGGLLAQGMPCFEAACAGVWLHGAAGTECGPCLTADDLEAGLRQALLSLPAR